VHLVVSTFPGRQVNEDGYLIDEYQDSIRLGHRLKCFVETQHLETYDINQELVCAQAMI
jgi:hypothetical protein